LREADGRWRDAAERPGAAETLWRLGQRWGERTDRARGKCDPPLQLLRFGEIGEGRLVISGIIRLVILD
jgi:hypothetical protein